MIWFVWSILIISTYFIDASLRAIPSGTQAPSITVLESKPISIDEIQHIHVEPWIAVNPRNPRNLISASIVETDRQQGSVIYSTLDGGRTWVRAAPPDAGVEKLFPGMDPMVSFDPSGNAYFSTISPLGGENFRVWKSVDGGRAWDRPVIVPGRSWDRQFVIADIQSDKQNERLYAYGKFPARAFGLRKLYGRDIENIDVLGVSSSMDGGKSFTFPRLMFPNPEHHIINATAPPLITPDAKLILPFYAYGWPKDEKSALVSGHLWVTVLDNKGGSFSEPIAVGPSHLHSNQEPWLAMKGLSVGQLAVDTSSGPYRGRLYAAWVSFEANRYQVFVARSTDGGGSWSDPVRVNDDQSAANHSNPGIAVSDEGMVGVVWNDRRNDPSDSCFQTFFAVSLDGGVSFSRNIAVGNKPTCPNGTGPAKGPFDFNRFGHRYINGGDTQGIVGLAGGTFHLAWINGESGVMQLWSSVVRVDKKSP
jgi:hypothetical protein